MTDELREAVKGMSIDELEEQIKQCAQPVRDPRRLAAYLLKMADEG